MQLPIEVSNMNRTEIENYVKAKSTFLTSHKHVIPESSGRKMKFKVTEQDIEHLVSDALYRAREVLNISDIWNLQSFFQSAHYIKSEKDEKSGKSYIHFHYYEITINGRVMFLNIREDKKQHTATLYSITKEIKNATPK